MAEAHTVLPQLQEGPDLAIAGTSNAVTHCTKTAVTPWQRSRWDLGVACEMLWTLLGLPLGACVPSRLCLAFLLDYRVYAAGGMGLDLRPHNYLQHYDMLKDMWVSLSPMPTPRYAATSFLRGSKIYVLGRD